MTTALNDRGAKRRHTDTSVYVILLGRRMNATFEVHELNLAHNMMSQMEAELSGMCMMAVLRLYLLWHTGMRMIESLLLGRN